MRMRPCAALAIATSLAIGCAAAEPKRASAPHADGSKKDAPYELADDRDLEMLRDRHDALPHDHDERQAHRAELADEYERRIHAAFDQRNRDGAYEAFTSLLSLWDPRELRGEDALAMLSAHREGVRRVRSVFARAGADRQAATALFVLAEIDPKRRAEHRAELDELFAFADELAAAEYGDGAERARPIEILEHTVEVFPTAQVLSRLVELYIERQEALGSQFRRRGTELRLIRAHGEGALAATRSLVRAHAHAFRLQDAHTAARQITGFGDDADLRATLERAVAGDGGSKPWLEIAAMLADGDGGSDDPVAARRVCEQGLAALGESAKLHACVAENAIESDAIALAIRHHEQALAIDPTRRESADRLAALYEHRVGRLAFDRRPGAAAEVLAKLADLDGWVREHWPSEPLDTTIADGRAAMGRGLVSIGALDEGREYLRRAMADGPHLRALEHLGIVELKAGRPQRGLEYFERGIAASPMSPFDRFDQNRMRRLASTAAEDAGQSELAERHARQALEAWASFQRDVGPLRAAYQGEMLVDLGKLRWRLGERDEALDTFARAVDADGDQATTPARVLSFLIIRDEPTAALDIYHRAVGSREIADDFKVYMSLWVAIDARLRGHPVDPVAAKFLDDRSGPLWHDDLARLASDRVDSGSIADNADTRGRRAELLYYRAMLEAMPADPDTARELLRRVLASDMVLYFEYDMARHWLEHGFELGD